MLERNVRTREGEIDLILFDGTVLVFAEVKTRRSAGGEAGLDRRETPLAGLRAGQQRRIRRLAYAWLADSARRRPRARTLRFDALGVVVDARGRLVSLEHLEGAF